MANLIHPDWPAPSQVKAYCTTREHGFSLSNYKSFNLAKHVNDDPTHVLKNRNLLHKKINANRINWLNQTHSNNVVEIDSYTAQNPADACHTQTPGVVCAVLTADCLPILLCDKSGTWVGAIHAGRLGLLKQIISKTIKASPIPAHEIMVWLGPGISQHAYQLPKKYYNEFISVDSENNHHFQESSNSLYNVDLYGIAKTELHRNGVKQIFGGNFCTYTQNQLFYSYRRDQKKTGRMASLIKLEHEQKT
ncbi:MAG: peptidoglycan editing factor PgeF [Gammaproteobacteria bacterium]|nr:peptidoglycan editing factor PgeF [Gammaproteobacteria bacterium]